MDKILICLLFFISTHTFSQNLFEKGVILDSIPVGKNNNETFALYLPQSFNAEILHSITFVFDPSARGKSGVKPFIQASEKYGFIIVCSNNSKNGPYNENFNIFNNLFSHITSIFNIKDQEMYLSGFSGGSRLACAIASITDLFSGVIACGAGFPQVPEFMPSSQKYLYVGLVGNQDFNFQEMVQNKTFLKEKNFKNTLLTFKGKHSWPKEDKILQAFDWLYLQQLNKNINQTNLKRITDLYNRDYTLTLEQQENNELLFAAENYERILGCYNSFFKLDSIKQQYHDLIQTKSYKQQVKSLSKSFKTETEITQKLLTKFDVDLKNPNSSNLVWWEKQLSKLREIENSEEQQLQNMAHRIKFNVFASIYSNKKFYLKNSSKEQSTYIDKLLKLLRSKP